MSDLISRQAAIDMLATMQGRCTSKTALIQNSKIWQQIKDMPSAQPEQRWILVTERLPGKGQIVLVVGKTKEINLARYTHPFFDFGENITSRVGKVTHWMPLPEPPKEEI